MDEELIQEYYKSIKHAFTHTSYEMEDGKKNPVYWEVNLESFLSSVNKHLEEHELLVDLKPIKKDFYWHFERMANEIFEVFEGVFKYVKEQKERSAVNSISIHLIDLKNDLKHLKGMSTSIKYIALDNSKKAYQIKELFIYHIERFIGWISLESIDIMRSPLAEYFKDIYDSYNSAFDLSKIQIEAELSKISNNTQAENYIDLSDTSASEKIIYLHELGILEFLRSKFEFGTSTNNLANIISSFTGVKPRTIQSYINPINNKSVEQSKSPLSNTKKVDEVKLKLIELGVIKKD